MPRTALAPLALLVLAVHPASATSITLPWIVEFPTTITNPPPSRTIDVSTPPIEGTYRTSSGGIDAPGLDIRAGFDVNVEAASTSAAFRLPVEVTIEAPASW